MPVLLESMVYSETEQYMLSSAMEDSSVPDQAQDIEPSQFKSRNGNDFEEDDEDDEFDDLSDDDDEDCEDDYSEWTLRKCAVNLLSLGKMGNKKERGG